MLEILTNGIEFIRSAAFKPRGHWERLENDQTDKERETSLRIAGVFGRVALSDYRRDDPIHKVPLDEFRDEMLYSGFSLSELGLTDADHMLIKGLTDLE